MDIEVMADEYEEEQEVLKELAEEEAKAKEEQKLREWDAMEAELAMFR